MSQHVVELHVVDFVSGLRLEPLVDQSELGLSAHHLEVVENGAEPGHANESGGTLILVLVEGLHEQAAVAHLSAESAHKRVEASLLVAVEHVAGVKDAGGGEAAEALGGVLLEVLLGEYIGDVLAEVYVVHERGVGRVLDAVHLLEELKLLSGEQDFLGVEDGAELGGRKDTLAEEVVVLEELEKADAVPFDNLFDLEHEGVEGLVTGVVNELGAVSALGAGVGAVDVEDEHVAVLEEVGVTDFVVGGAVAAVDLGNAGDLGLGQGEAVSGEHLAEDLGGHLEVAVLVEVLEERLRVETVLADYLLEAKDNVVNAGNISLAGVLTAVDGLSLGIVKGDVNGAFEVLLGEDLIDAVAEVTPQDVLALFGGLEVGGDELELGVADHNLGHGEADAELGVGDESGS